jgi:hypothetical protein
MMSVRGRAGVTLAACALGVIIGVGASAPGGKLMSAVPPSDDQRLAAYLRADEKYHVAPVPTPIDRAVAVRFVNAAVAKADAAAMRKLERLVVFHNLRETGRTFVQVLQGTESSPTEFERSTLAVVAVAWIGDAPMIQSAQRYFGTLQRRTSVERNRHVMLEACLALGPSEGTAGHREWVGKEISNLESALARYQQQGQAREARMTQIRIDELQEYLLVEVGRADAALALRSRLEGSTPEVRAQQLAVLYVGESSQATPEVSYWAGMTLVRVAAGGPSRRDRLADELLKLARARETPPPGQTQLEADLKRARALRAVELLGLPLDARERDWLDSQPDPGTDVLALRPGWKYPGLGT